MKTIKITKDEFDDILYPALSRSSASSMAELETALRVMRKVNDPQFTKIERLKEQDIELARSMGTRAIPLRKLAHSDRTLKLEEDEWHLVTECIKAYIPQISLLGIDILNDLLQKLLNPDDTDISQSIGITK